MPSNMNNKLDPILSSSIRREFSDSGIGSSADGKFRTISTSSCATNMSTESYCISLGVGPLWWSDVPTHHRTDHDRASLLTDYTRKISVDSGGGSLCESTSSSECSDLDSQDGDGDGDGDVHSLYSDDDCQEVVKQILQHNHPIRIIIKLHVTENKFTKWESVLNPLNNILYVSMPEELPPEASKQTFVSLLEFAEDKLDVDAVVLIIKKNQTDRARLIETFFIMGFQPLSRKSPMAPPATENNSENFFLIYNIED
ncbi:LOW QUALITY PROTEIN: ornithine decarboxylase antizyme [Teleopsis dalmanni]|uniref:LOW QUALITY PROTEIN: ornithine decarboxylase antizyme n=1 Tax=Teleopsis dalmanni TaxID=139649 RepID=UPI0018CF69DB|nr:LOW QUALITY PROTEIN: ornithine decarboxylase antizyme [Teleopsis dalmanni]